MIVIYNWVMAIYSLATFIATGPVLWRNPLFTEDCGAFWREPAFPLATKFFYLSKFVEYLDTFWLYLMNKPVSWLQWYHHLGAPHLMWNGYYAKSEGVWTFVILNSFVHTIMYSYYALTVNAGGEKKPIEGGEKHKDKSVSNGEKPSSSEAPSRSERPKKSAKEQCLKSMKPFITLLQVVQLAIGWGSLLVYFKVKCAWNDLKFRYGYQIHGLFYVGALLILFLNFFVQNYMKPEKPRAPKPKKGEDDAPRKKEE